ncbi:MAG: type 4a pilus biogenesis protein PilO [Armatimonadota bacterium]|nr:type 4a pilus biogenesis protein PilO [Armatimonadota bacterium]
MAVSKRIQQAQRKVRLLTIAAGATLLLGLGSLFFPWQAIQAQQAQLQEKLQALQTAQHATSQLRIALQQLQLTQQELRFLERGVSEAAYVPTMLKQFEQTARQHQLQIVAIRPQQPQTNPSQNDKSAKNNQPYEEQLFEIQLRGKFWGLMSLLKSLESFPKILSVQTLYAQAKSGSEQAPENPDLEIRMVVKAFIFRADQTPAPSET